MPTVWEGPLPFQNLKGFWNPLRVWCSPTWRTSQIPSCAPCSSPTGSVDDAVNCITCRNLDTSRTYAKILYVDFSLPSSPWQPSPVSAITNPDVRDAAGEAEENQIQHPDNHCRCPPRGMLVSLLFLDTSDCTSREPSVKPLKFTDGHQPHPGRWWAKTEVPITAVQLCFL